MAIFIAGGDASGFLLSGSFDLNIAISIGIYPNITEVQSNIETLLDALIANKSSGQRIYLSEIQAILNDMINNYDDPSLIRYKIDSPSEDIVPGEGQSVIFSYSWSDYFSSSYETNYYRTSLISGDIFTDPFLGDLLTDISKTKSLSNVDYALESAVLISLFTDKRAKRDSILPSDISDKRGWWGDQVFPFIDGDQIGSFLWLLERSKTQPNVLIEAKQYIKDALQWMVDDKVILKFVIKVERYINPPNDRIDFNVVLYKTDGTYTALNFDGNFGIKIG